MTMIVIDTHHLIAVLQASETAIDLISSLPKCDLCDELRDLLDVQAEILTDMSQGTHFGSSRLSSYIDYCNNIKYEIARIDNAAE